MKKPRDLLLDRHRAAEPELDAIRMEVRQTLANHGANRATAPTPPRESWISVLWQELFVSCRRYWAGLGVAWCAIVLLTLVGAWNGTTGRVIAAIPSEPVMEALLEQKQLRDELLGLVTVQETRTARREDNLGPRSEGTIQFVHV